MGKQSHCPDCYPATANPCACPCHVRGDVVTRNASHLAAFGAVGALKTLLQRLDKERAEVPHLFHSGIDYARTMVVALMIECADGKELPDG